jgi:hypothetical protein
LKDLDQMLVREPPNWDELVRRARQWRVDLPAAMQLDRTRCLLGSPVPPDVVEALGGGLWWEVWRRRQRSVDFARWGEEVRMSGRMVTAATSRNTVSSLRQLGRAVLDEVVRPQLVARRSTVSHPVPELYRPVGEDDGRAAYLDEVGAGVWR